MLRFHVVLLGQNLSSFFYGYGPAQHFNSPHHRVAGIVMMPGLEAELVEDPSHGLVLRQQVGDNAIMPSISPCLDELLKEFCAKPLPLMIISNDHVDFDIIGAGHFGQVTDADYLGLFCFRIPAFHYQRHLAVMAAAQLSLVRHTLAEIQHTGVAQIHTVLRERPVKIDEEQFILRTDRTNRSIHVCRCLSGSVAQCFIEHLLIQMGQERLILQAGAENKRGH